MSKQTCWYCGEDWDWEPSPYPEGPVDFLEDGTPLYIGCQYEMPSFLCEPCRDNIVAVSALKHAVDEILKKELDFTWNDE